MKNKRLFWRIVEYIETSIDNGDYTPGSRLPPERELAENFSVSRPTIREAIIALEVRGKVEVKTGSGVYVLADKNRTNTTSPINAFELTQARALIEGEVAALAASSISDQDLERLKSALDKMAGANNIDDADQMFHQIIANATQNNALTLSVQKLWGLRESTPEITAQCKTICKEDKQTTLAEHTAIYQALKSRDSKAARATMHDHFNRLINRLFDSVEAKALEEIHRQNNEKRVQYSIANLAENK